MGSLIGDLSNTSIQAPGMTPQYAGSPGQIAQKLSQADVGMAQPSAASIGDSGDVSYSKPAESAPKISKPSFMQSANSGPGGTPSALNPALTSKGKLLTVLLNAAKGGGAGAGSMTFGQGFSSGAELPFVQAQMKQGAQRGELENKQLALQSQYAPQIMAQNFRKQNADINKSQADATKSTAEAAAVPSHQALQEAQAEAAKFKEVGGMLYDTSGATPQPVAGQTVPLSEQEAAVLGKNPGDRVPIEIKNKANEMVNRGFTTVNTEQGVYERNRGTGKMTRLGNNPRMMFAPGEQYTPVVADPNDPGNITLMKKGQAAAQGVSLPQSAEAVTAKATAKSVAPGGKVGEEINAFNTAIEHAKLLKQVALALKNGDSRTLSGLSNKFKSEFGSADLNNFNVVAGAYSREITKMLSAGHMTDSEIGSAGATLPSNANPDTLLQAAGLYQQLAESKMQQRRNQVNQGMKGKANFPGTDGNAPKPTHRYNPQTHQIEAIN